MESQHLGYSVRYISSIPYRSTAYYLFYFQTTPYRPYHFAYSFSRTEAPFPPGNINDFRYTSGERDRRFTSSSGFRSQNKEATYLINYIEDHLEIRLYLKLIFSNEYNLLMAENGEEGFKKACEGVPDLIITDIIMPVMDGFKCCQLIKENLTTCHIPVILLTALTSETDIMKGIELGADDYIQKPFNPNILRTKVKRLIKSREELKEIYTRLLTPTSEPEASPEEKTGEAGLHFPEDPFIIEIVRIINENMKNPDFNVKKLADIMVISQPTLYRRVKTLTNFTISEFIRGVRLKRAAELLRSRRYTVQDIAEMVGYNDLATFRKHFVDFYGTTPSTFCNKMLMEKSE